MCGRFTRRYTWEELVRLYRLTDPYFISNLQLRYNICPTTTIDTVVEYDGRRALEPMRWGLIPAWWSKPLKEMKLATFNARVGQKLKSCAMIITEPNKIAAEVHDRMPVFLQPEQFEGWLSSKAGKEVLVPAPEDMLPRWPVSKRVNSSRASDEDASLIAILET